MYSKAQRIHLRPRSSSGILLQMNAKVWFAPFVLFLFIGFNAQARDDFKSPAQGEDSCGYSHVRLVNATPDEKTAACYALDKILKYFSEFGVVVDPNVKVIFADVVLTPNDQTPVYGYFDTDTHEIHITHFRSPRQLGRESWRLPWSDELASSILLHEISHLVAIDSMGSEFRKVTRVWHEGIAYFIQFELMSENLRQKIFSIYGDEAAAFAALSAINSFSYGMDPHLFAIKVYGFVRNNGGAKFIKDLLDGKVAGISD